MNKYILYVQNDTGEHCEYDGDMEETEAIPRNPVRTLKERNEAIVESTARYVYTYVRGTHLLFVAHSSKWE